jgi:hypothetical protein
MNKTKTTSVLVVVLIVIVLINFALDFMIQPVLEGDETGKLRIKKKLFGAKKTEGTEDK